MLPNGPAIPSFDSALDMLTACHGKIRRFARLCERLARHTAEHGADEQASTAAASIVRYFTIAAPLHHADEEEDLFPALRALGDDGLTSSMQDLEGDHDALEALWKQVLPWLEAVQQGSAGPAPEALFLFASRYVEHVDREEREVFARAQGLPAPILQSMGRRMAVRRGAQG
ncbi:hemerythrin domain-containing protein [Cupriavidus sp. AU9028]|uniref:hemerythrin domain-containing protein n=1 Tax=Cupriavidus sp. AU9028 TaxID=2871157 RepID=UPI001C9553A7|nr:hemerythrin domain-containing protein [Cupriavidus sp. AU9028]MBY4897038.1 hemerythrin domain-containing protein [Cupriavidus sp. AU9028]